jgi:hypothetical protein
MSCYTCGTCTATHDINYCFDEITFGQFANGPVRLTFVNMADGGRVSAEGTAVGGVLTIDAEDLPQFTDGVAYKVTASEDWTLGGVARECVTIRTVRTRDAEGEIITGTSEVLSVCA